MGLLKRKKQIKNIETSDYDYRTNLDLSRLDESGKKKKRKFDRRNLITAFDLMQSEIVKDKDQLLGLCDIILNGRAVLANFEKLTVEDANYMLTFLSGAVYALDGEVHKTGAKTFLFAGKKQYLDGTLHQFIEDIK
jgi:FtsZ-interacting cell division protein YlmF